MKQRKNETSKGLTFHQWGNKSFSLFSALNKVLRIGALSVSYLVAVPVQDAVAQEVNQKAEPTSILDEQEVEEIVVSALRAPAAFSEVARVVTVVDRKEIEAAPVQSITDLLEYSLAVDIRQRGNHGVQADVSMRGGSFDQVLILLNGISINDPQTGHHNMNLPVPLDAVERIEILEGPASRVYGMNAFSGAINIITGTSKSSNIKAKVSAGEHGFYDAGVNTTIVSKKLTNYVSINHKQSDGYIENTDFESTNVFYQGELRTDEVNFEVQAGFTQNGFGANSFYTPEYPNQYEETKTTFVSAKMETGKTVHVTPSVYWRRNQDRFELYRDNPADWYKDHNYHLTDVYGLNVDNYFVSDLGKTAFGASFRSENILSNNIGNPLEDPIEVPGEDGHYFDKSHSRTNVSLFLEQSYYYNRWSFSAGVMGAFNSDLGKDWDFSPGADVSFQTTDWMKWYGSVNTSLRLPTFTDLFYTSRTSVGDPDLKPEEAITYESGFKFTNPVVSGRILGYYRDVDNMIDWVAAPGETVYKATNLSNLKIKGFEASLNWNPRRQFGNHFFIKRFNMAYAYMDQDKGTVEDYDSKYALDYLKHKATLNIDHVIYKNIGLNWNVTFQDRNGGYNDWNEQSSSFGALVDYDPFWLTDLRLYWQNKQATIYVEASNLFDATYYDYGNVVQPGRWVRAGLTYRFDL